MNKTNIDGSTALHLACIASQRTCVRLLVIEGASIIGMSKIGITFLEKQLRQTAFTGDVEYVRALLAAGVEVDAEDGGGYTSLMYACMSGHEPVFRLLIDKGAEIEKASNHGYMPLIIASVLGREAITLALLTAGADPLVVDRYGKTAEQEALRDAQNQCLPEEERARIRRCIELLQQPRVEVP